MSARRTLRVAPITRKRRMRSILRYTGSKAYGISGWVGYIPPHKTYVEVFTGSGEMFFAKEPSEIEVLNDLEPGLVNFLRVLRSDVLYERLVARLLRTACSRDVWRKAVRMLAEKVGSRVSWAWAYFVRMEQSFWGMAASFGGGEERTWQNRVRRLPKAHDRLLGCRVERFDFRRCLARWDGPDTLFFLDPPAVPGTRDSHLARNYSNLLSMSDWKELLEVVTSCSGMVLLAPYEDHPIHAFLRRKGWDMLYRSEKKRGKVRVLRLWMNPAAVSRLAGAE